VDFFLSTYRKIKCSEIKYVILLPNVVVECLTLLLRIWEVPGSNLGPETGCPDAFYGFPQSLQENSG
jgi:hypothetical protein